MLALCVPNFSEGRDPAVIDALCEAARSVAGAELLDLHTDPDHHRCVLTVAGEAKAVSEAVFRAVKVATLRIDMTQHQGVHPRLGAADVVPFVPLAGATMSDCVDLSHRFAERCASELGLPCYLYAGAARHPNRVSLPWLRKPQFEGLADAMTQPERAPDCGSPRPHPTAGATVVGARGFLVAFNVDLATDDVSLAREIAKAIRESSGGLKGVQAKGLDLATQGRVQVSMNLLRFEAVGPGQVYREIERRARAAGAEIASSELIGLMPRAAAVSAAGELLQLRGAPLADRVVEARLGDLFDPAGPLAQTAKQIAGDDALDPGGGSAVALGLALGRSCLAKAIALSKDERGELSDDELDALSASLPSVEAFLALASEDHTAFSNMMAAFRLPRGDVRKATLDATRGPAVAVPRRMLDLAIQLAEAAAVLAERGNDNLINDAVAAAELALSAGRVARLNARANQRRQDRDDLAEPLDRLEQAAARARRAAG